MTKKAAQIKAEILKGWTAIVEFLGLTPAVAKRWHDEGLPVRKEGRFVYASPEELTR